MMQSLRVFFRTHPGVAGLLLAAALLIKLLVPAGAMLKSDATILTVVVCGDATGAAQMRQIVLPRDEGDGSKLAEDRDSKGVCAFGALGLTALGGADPVLNAAAIAFLIALGFTATPSFRVARRRFQRPPLRGPPALA